MQTDHAPCTLCRSLAETVRVSVGYDDYCRQLNLPSFRKRKPMADLSAVVAQLKAERAKLDKAIAVLSGLDGRTGSSGGGRRKLSPAARARIAAARRARWAKFKAKKAR